MDDNFVVITGPPQQGKIERISKVRSHIKKRYHQQRHSQRRMLAADEAHLQLMHIQPMSSGMLRELAYIKLDPTWLFASKAACLRMQSFVYQFLMTTDHFHPFFRTVIPAAVIHVPMMSVKILNASLYDDLNSPSGDIAPVTLSQRNIAMGLLSESLTHAAEAVSDVNIASLISFLTFEFVNGDREAFNRHARGIQHIIERRGGLDQLGFEGHLKTSVLIVRELQKVIRHVSDPEPLFFSAPSSSLPVDDFDLSLSQPPNLNVFTLQQGPNDMELSRISPSVRRHLSDFHQLVMLSIEFCKSSHDPESRRWILTQWGHLHAQLRAINEDSPSSSSSPSSSATISDPKAAVIRQAALLFASLSVPPSAEHSTTTTTTTGRGAEQAARDFQSILRLTEIYNFWDPIPGALIWCLVVGARISPPGSTRKWLLMQITRVWPLALDQSDGVLGSLRVVSRALDAVEVLKTSCENERKNRV